MNLDIERIGVTVAVASLVATVVIGLPPLVTLRRRQRLRAEILQSLELLEKLPDQVATQELREALQDRLNAVYPTLASLEQKRNVPLALRDWPVAVTSSVTGVSALAYEMFGKSSVPLWWGFVPVLVFVLSIFWFMVSATRQMDADDAADAAREPLPDGEPGRGV